MLSWRSNRATGRIHIAIVFIALAFLLVGSVGIGGIGDASAQNASGARHATDRPDKKPSPAGQHGKRCKNPESDVKAILCQQLIIAETTERIRGLTVRLVSNSRWQMGLLAAILAATAIAAIAAVWAASAVLNRGRSTEQIVEIEPTPETIVSDSEVRPPPPA